MNLLFESSKTVVDYWANFGEHTYKTIHPALNGILTQMMKNVQFIRNIRDLSVISVTLITAL